MIESLMVVTELQRQRAKDEAERKRHESMAGQTRFYGEALKHSLPKMGLDPIEFPSLLL